MDQLTSELSMLSRLLDASTIRTRVIAHNMANVNTPGFKRSEVTFEEDLRKALSSGNMSAMEKLKPEVKVSEGGEVKVNGNNVHLEDEIGDLVKTTMVYNTLNRLLSGKIDSLKLAIRGR